MLLLLLPLPALRIVGGVAALLLLLLLLLLVRLAKVRLLLPLPLMLSRHWTPSSISRGNHISQSHTNGLDVTS